jgi:hypothetical protein
MGGAGPEYVPRQLATTLLTARASLASTAATWLPAPYHDLLSLHPEDGALAEAVLGIAKPPLAGQGEGGEGEEVDVVAGPASWEVTAEERAAADAADDTPQPAKENAVYTTPAPRTLPIGALTQLKQVQELQALRQAATAGGQ